MSHWTWTAPLTTRAASPSRRSPRGQIAPHGGPPPPPPSPLTSPHHPSSPHQGGHRLRRKRHHPSHPCNHQLVLHPGHPQLLTPLPHMIKSRVVKERKKHQHSHNKTKEEEKQQQRQAEEEKGMSSRIKRQRCERSCNNEGRLRLSAQLPPQASHRHKRWPPRLVVRMGRPGISAWQRMLGRVLCEWMVSFGPSVFQLPRNCWSLKGERSLVRIAFG